MTYDIKPCPFCGGPAIDDRGGDVHCQNERCPGWDMWRCATEKWNTRADLVLADPRVKALVDAGDALDDEYLNQFPHGLELYGMTALRTALAKFKEPKE